MPQLVEFEGQRHEFPDDFTQADIQRALSPRPRAPRPIQVQGPDGAIVEFPVNTSNEEMTTALRKHYGAPAEPPMPPLPPGYKLDPRTGVPPPPPGYTPDRKSTLVPVEHDPFAQPAAPPQPKLVPVDHDPWASFPNEKPPFDPTQPFQEVAPAPPAAATAPATGAERAA
ncbi:hypothetical protein MOV75_21705, partial [Bradyrhizobium sp. PRIMUS42]|nr:hypothetical protein [Bradyrhizobium sp. PRIMUS42]